MFFFFCSPSPYSTPALTRPPLAFHSASRPGSLHSTLLLPKEKREERKREKKRKKERKREREREMKRRRKKKREKRNREDEGT